MYKPRLVADVKNWWKWLSLHCFILLGVVDTINQVYPNVVPNWLNLVLVVLGVYFRVTVTGKAQTEANPDV